MIHCCRIRNGLVLLLLLVLLLILSSSNTSLLPEVSSISIAGYDSSFHHHHHHHHHHHTDQLVVAIFHPSNNISSATPETILPRLFGKLPHHHSRKNNYVNPHNWPYFRSNDGRHGQVLCVPLPHDPDGCMACSRQIAVNCTTTHVIQAYLSAELQLQWNRRHVQSVSFHPVSISRNLPKHHPTQCVSSCVRQDLVLHSQRVLRGQTGPLKYSQRLTIHQTMMMRASG